MKLVAAKCPSCGANIDVDENSDNTVCEYCRTKIIVSDAIQKYKIELSGSVEIKNAPKLENYLKLGARHYENGEYDDALEAYAKALELDPDNYIAILRRGISKTLNTSYINFEIDSCINGLKNAYNLLKHENKNNEISDCIIECKKVISTSEQMLLNYYNKNSQNMYLDDMEDFSSNLIACYNGYEYLYEIIPNENKTLKILILKSLIDIINLILSSKKYNPNTEKAGFYYYKVRKSISEPLTKKRELYKSELASLSPEEASKTKKYSNFNIDSEMWSKTWICLLFLFVFYPIGMFIMWKNKKFTSKTRIILSVIFGIIFIDVIISAANSPNNTNTTNSTNTTNTSNTTQTSYIDYTFSE